jgi:hypothetical protein
VTDRDRVDTGAAHRPGIGCTGRPEPQGVAMSPKSHLALTAAIAAAAVSAPTAAAMPADPFTPTDARGEHAASLDARGEHAASLSRQDARSEYAAAAYARGEAAASRSQTAPAFDLRTADAREPDSGPVSTQPVVVEVPESSQPGFDWTDAGIGAAGGLALTVLFGSGIVLARRRMPRPTVG